MYLSFKGQRTIFHIQYKRTMVFLIHNGSVHLSSVHPSQKIDDLEATTISKQEVNDELRNILAYVYLLKHKEVLFFAFFHFFLIISVIHHFNMAMGHAYSLLGWDIGI